jgi:protein SCO1/2
VDVQVLFVTVDPERDTSEQLGKYVGYFNPQFIGLGGSIDQVMSLATQVGAVFMYGDKSGDGAYPVDHTAALFLIDPKGRVVAVFSAPHQVDSIRDRYKMIRNFVASQAES